MSRTDISDWYKYDSSLTLFRLYSILRANTQSLNTVLENTTNIFEYICLELVMADRYSKLDWKMSVRDTRKRTKFFHVISAVIKRQQTIWSISLFKGLEHMPKRLWLVQYFYMKISIKNCHGRTLFLSRTDTAILCAHSNVWLQTNCQCKTSGDDGLHVCKIFYSMNPSKRYIQLCRPTTGH